MTEPLSLLPVSFADLSRARCWFHQCRLPSDERLGCLVITFEGEAGNGAEHRGTFAYMKAMIVAGVAAWSPAAIVLDLTRLGYRWGDEMDQVLGAARRPTAVVVSERNREGLTSLVRDETGADPAESLHESVAEAVRSCDGKSKAVLKNSVVPGFLLPGRCPQCGAEVE